MLLKTYLNQMKQDNFNNSKAVMIIDNMIINVVNLEYNLTESMKTAVKINSYFHSLINQVNLRNKVKNSIDNFFKEVKLTEKIDKDNKIIDDFTTKLNDFYQMTGKNKDNRYKFVLDMAKDLICEVNEKKNVIMINEDNIKKIRKTEIMTEKFLIEKEKQLEM